MKMDYTRKCPNCQADLQIPKDPELGRPLIYEPFACPSCNTLIEVSCDEVEGEDGDYDWTYWLDIAGKPKSL